MSSLVVEVCKITEVFNHPNADRMDLARIKGWQCCVKKDQYKAGDIVVFIPPDSDIPKELAERLGIMEYLGGKKKNRVKTVKLRGEISEGIIIPNELSWPEGTDVAEYYGITKFIPPVRASAGDAGPEDVNFMRLTDIENIKNYPNTFAEGQMVAITEKVDGTQDRCGVSRIVFEIDDESPLGYEVYDITDQNEEDPEPAYAIWKAGSNKVNRRRPDEDSMKSNTYWFPYTLDSVLNLVEYLIMEKGHKHVQLFGEIIGEGISGGSKRLNYGITKGLAFRAFGIKIDKKKAGYKLFKELCDKFDVPRVPEVAVISYDFDSISKMATGKSILAAENGADHIREGVVACAYEGWDGPIAKFMNPDYILLKERGKVDDFTDE